jgi:hypothetical protein
MVFASKVEQLSLIGKSFLTRVMVPMMALASIGTLCTSAAQSEVVLRKVDGGPEFYGRFSHHLPTNPKYFPIGVWLEAVHEKAHTDLDKDAGINLYVGLTANSDLSVVQDAGMKALLQLEWLERSEIRPAAIASPANAGWMLWDEIDMQHGPPDGNAFEMLENIIRNELPEDGRMRYNNYGKGVMFWESNNDAQRFINEFNHVASNDAYWFTDPAISHATQGGKLLNHGTTLTTTQTRRAANYGYVVDRMRALDAMAGPVKGKPIWNFVEVCWPWTESAAQGARAILPAEVRAAVWHSIIAGARGIIYFNHSFGGPYLSQHCLREPYYASVRATVKKTNDLIRKLAPVLNAKFADGFVTASPSVRVMAKRYDKKYYVFAGSKENTASTPTFRLSGINRGTAKVIGEPRIIPISNGQFTDHFADGNAIHIYRIEKSR